MFADTIGEGSRVLRCYIVCGCLAGLEITQRGAMKGTGCWLPPSEEQIEVTNRRKAEPDTGL